MVAFELESEIYTDGVLAAVKNYSGLFEEAAAERGATIMRTNMRVVPEGTPPSEPGSFPHSRTGKLSTSITVAESDEGYVFGPEYKPPPTGYFPEGGKPIARILNDGGVILVRRRVSRRRLTGQAAVRLQIRPRPYLELTLELLASELPEIANEAKLN